MAERAAITELIKAYDDYVRLAEGLGMRAVKGNVRRHALNGLGYQGEMKSFFSETYAERHPGRTLPREALERMRGLVADLAKKLCSGAGRKIERDNGWVAELVGVVKAMPTEKRDELCGAVVAGTHGQFLKRREAPISL